MEMKIRVPTWLGKALARWPGSVLLLVSVLVLALGPVQGARLAGVDIRAGLMLDRPLFGLYLFAYFLSSALWIFLFGLMVASLRQDGTVVDRSTQPSADRQTRPPRLISFFGSRLGVIVLTSVPLLAVVGIVLGVVDPGSTTGRLTFLASMAVWWGLAGLVYSGARSAIGRLSVVER